MRKLFILIGLCLTLTLSGQNLIPGIMSSQGGTTGCGGGTDNYGFPDLTTGETNMNENFIYYTSVDIIICGTVASVTCKTGENASTQSYIAIYTDNGGVPGSLLTNGTSSALSESVSTSNTWTFSTPPSVSSSTTYWVAFLTTGGGHALYQASGGSQSVYYESGTAFPSDASSALLRNNDKVPFYVTVNH